MASSTQQHPLHVERAAKIALIEREDKILSSVFGRKDDKANALRWSAGGRKSNRVAEIANLELDMALEGVPFEAYVPKQLRAVSKNSQLAKSEAEIKESLAALRTLLANPANKDRAKLQESGTKRVQGLLAAAKRLGYTSIA